MGSGNYVKRHCFTAIAVDDAGNLGIYAESRCQAEAIFASIRKMNPLSIRYCKTIHTASRKNQTAFAGNPPTTPARKSLPGLASGEVAGARLSQRGKVARMRPTSMPGGIKTRTLHLRRIP